MVGLLIIIGIILFIVTLDTGAFKPKKQKRYQNKSSITATKNNSSTYSKTVTKEIPKQATKIGHKPSRTYNTYNHYSYNYYDDYTYDNSDND
jgi:hypothetical protein